MSFISTYNSLSTRGYQSLGQINYSGRLNFGTTNANQNIGFSLSLSSDANYLAVGAPGTSNNTGRVYIFNNSSNIWSLQTSFSPTGNSSSGDFFGGSVALNEDGTYLIVGADNRFKSGTAAGEAWVFTRSGNTWAQQQQLIANVSTIGDLYGTSVSINGNGDKVVIGAPRGSAPIYSKAITFSRSGNTWTQTSVLQSSPTAEDGFGSSVSMDNSGNYIAIGAPFDDSIVTNNGLVYIYNNLSLQQTITANNNANTSQQFGSAVEMGYNGDKCILSASIGQAEYWTRTGNTWSYQTQFLNGGSDASLSADGNWAGVSGNVFNYNGSVWNFVYTLQAPDISATYETTAISNNATFIFAGYPDEDSPSTNIGAVALWQI